MHAHARTALQQHRAPFNGAPRDLRARATRAPFVLSSAAVAAFAQLARADDTHTLLTPL